MRYVKFAIAGFGILGVILSLSVHLLSYGSDGAIVVAGCAIPAALAAYGTFARPSMPRWAAIISAVAFLVVGMKTTDNKLVENIMMAAFGGMIAAVILAIRPERARA